MVASCCWDSQPAPCSASLGTPGGPTTLGGARAARAACAVPGGLDATAATNAGRCFHCWDNFSDFAMERQQKLERNQHGD